jgi:pyruvate-formate lyase
MTQHTTALVELDYGALKSSERLVSVARERQFTEAHRRLEGAHPWQREAACLRVQAELTLLPIQAGDLFAGRLWRMAVGIDPERGDLTEAAYFCRTGLLEAVAADAGLSVHVRHEAVALLAYWQGRVTHRRCREAFPAHLREGLPSDDYYANHEIAYPMYGLGGPCLDYDRLVRRGLPGLGEELRARRARTASDEEAAFLEALAAGLDVVREAALRYARQARAQLSAAAGEVPRVALERIASSLERIAQAAPAHFHEAVQLVWLYALVALPKNYGRLDVTLGDLLVRDLESGVLDEEAAIELTVGLWRLVQARGDNFNNRIVIGGRGRRNEANADRFAAIALEAQARAGDTIPQLSLRWHAGMPQGLWLRALEVIALGSTFPIVYNDDVNVPAVASAFGVSTAQAQRYVPYGCGEYVLESRSVGSPDGALNVLKALDVTLRDGRDGFAGERRGLALGHLRDFATFEELQQAFARQVEHHVALLAQAQATIYRETAREACFPLLSLLYDDCLERARPLLAGGVRHLGGTLESFGNNSAADSLLAIRRAVYEERWLSADGLLACLDADFAGHERERRRLAAVPKFGNDDDVADAMASWVNAVVCGAAKRQAARVGLDSFLVVLVNNGDSVLFGKRTGASADGRRSGEPVSNGNQPSAGADHAGLTALLNSMARLDPSLHAGATHNVRLARGLFGPGGGTAGPLLRGYFARGGTQLMVSVSDRGELERALAEPERYRHLIVRVGGYSERFVDLPREVQLELLRRTLH